MFGSWGRDPEPRAFPRGHRPAALSIPLDGVIPVSEAGVFCHPFPAAVLSLLHPCHCSIHIPVLAPSHRCSIRLCSVPVAALSLLLLHPHPCLFQRSVLCVSQHVWALPCRTPLLLQWHLWVSPPLICTKTPTVSPGTPSRRGRGLWRPLLGCSSSLSRALPVGAGAGGHRRVAGTSAQWLVPQAGH